jgi:hypothetical protein
MLTDWRAEGRSWDEMAKYVWADTDRRISVSGQTVANWAERLGIAEPQPERAA